MSFEIGNDFLTGLNRMFARNPNNLSSNINTNSELTTDQVILNAGKYQTSPAIQGPTEEEITDCERILTGTSLFDIRNVEDLTEQRILEQQLWDRLGAYVDFFSNLTFDEVRD